MFYTVLHFLTSCCSNTHKLDSNHRFHNCRHHFYCFFTVLPLIIGFLCNVEKISGANDFVLSNILLSSIR